ncbi:Gag-Pol polyprotein [Formica fusca]
MATLDLKDAYYLVPIEKISRKFLRFLYKGELFEFTCLPFGLNVAPYVFTKLLKPVAAYLRKQGFASVFYMDDILIIGRSYEKCVINIRETTKLLQELEFRINEEKSLTVPTQRCKYLGLIFDSKKMSIELPEDKVRRMDLLNKFSKITRCTIREFAAFVGTLVSRCPALKYGMIHVRRFEKERSRALQANYNNFDATMTLSENFDDIA